MLWATNENTSGYVLRFYSSEATPDSIRPKLEVIWSNTPQTVYFLKDHLGSIRATVYDSAAAVFDYDDYDPWGYTLAQRTKEIPNAYLQGGSKIKFTGKFLVPPLAVLFDGIQLWYRTLALAVFALPTVKFLQSFSTTPPSC